MKKIISTLVFTLLVFFCTNELVASTISGEISFPDGRYQDSLAIELSYFRSLTHVNEALHKQIQTGTDFLFDVEPGKYTLLIYSFGCENFRKDLAVVDFDTDIKLDITLPKKGIDKDIKVVRINGEFTGWDGTKGIKLIKTGDVWKLEDTSILSVGDSYEFILDDDPHEVIDIATNNIRYADMFGWQGFYDGGEIIFDPSLYVEGTTAPSSTVSGSAIQEEYAKLLVTLDEYDHNLGDRRDFFENKEYEEIENNYKEYSRILAELKKKTSPSLQQMILEEQLRLIMVFHPHMLRFRELYEDGSPSPVKINEFLKSDAFIDYYETTLEMLSQLDPDSFLFENEFSGALFNIQFYADNYPILAQTYGVDKNYTENFLVNFISKSRNDRLCGELLFFYANQLAYTGGDEKAKYYTAQLMEKYPEHEWVNNGNAQALLDRLKIIVGFEAPEFSLQTTDGKGLTLSEFRGKFVFLDFWGTWCGPCIGELPNMKKMAESFPAEVLQIIGLARDSYEDLSAYLEIDPLPYPNALLPEEVEKAYGIKAYPTTFLLDPDGIIIGKNLRGHDLASIVKEKIDEYKTNN
jgi:thiol-disulfide isomerase/thioredoxin